MNALIIATDGFEDSELTYPYYRLREDDVETHIATPDGEQIEGKIGEEMEADLAIDDVDTDDYDLLVVPGGRSPEYLRLRSERAIEIVREFDDDGKPIAAICHGAQLLISADVLDGRDATCYWSVRVDLENAGATFRDESAVVDDNLVTSRYPDDLPEFMKATLDAMRQRTATA